MQLFIVLIKLKISNNSAFLLTGYQKCDSIKPFCRINNYGLYVTSGNNVKIHGFSS